MKPRLKIICATIAMLSTLPVQAAPSTNPQPIENYHEYMVRSKVAKAVNRMMDTFCYANVEKQAIADESLERAGTNKLCLLKSMPDVTQMSDLGVLLKKTTREKEGEEMTLVMRPSIESAGEHALMVVWHCGVIPNEAMRFVPEHCRNPEDPQKEMEQTGEPQTETLDLAVSWNDLDEVKRQVAAGADINKVSRKDGDTPLITALRRGHPDMIDYLLSQGAAVNATGINGVSPLMVAIEQSDSQSVASLLKAGADVKARDSLNQKSVLHYLARSQIAAHDVEIASVLLASGADVNTADKNGVTPLHVAVMQSNVPLKNNCSDYGSGNVNCNNKSVIDDNNIVIGDKDLVSCLLHHGAQINAHDKMGRTPLLFVLLGNGSGDVADRLVASGAEFVNGVPPLSEAYAAALRGNTGIFNEALKRHADIQVRDEDGSTVLHAAALSGNLAIARTTMDRGVSVTATDNNDLTPLHDAAIAGNLPMVKLLVARGAEINGQSRKEGYTPLIEAILNDHDAVAEWLIVHGADVNLMSRSMESPLHIAVEKGNLDMAVLLLNHGADINSSHQIVKDKNIASGVSPLMIALTLQRGNLDLMTYLLDHGAAIQKNMEISFASDGGLQIKLKFSPLALALASVDGWNSSSIDLMLAHGASAKEGVTSDVYLKDKKWMEIKSYPLSFVAAYGDGDTINTLFSHGAEVNKKSVKKILLSARDHMDKQFMSVLANGEDNLRFLMNEQDGWTPLHYAAAAGNLSTAKALLRHGANQNLRDAKGKKAVDYAGAGSEVAKLLSEHSN
jgi:ankyrin repeat protein